MDIGSIVDWVQLAIWVVAAIIFFFKWMQTERVTRSDKVILGGLILIGFLLSSYSLYRQYTGKAAQLLLEGWGIGRNECMAKVNGSMLMAWREKYDFVVVCGLRDQRQDELESTQIAVSPLFSIRPERIELQFPVSKEMLEGAEKRSGAIWFRVALLPKRTDVSRIKRLSDIPRYEGVISGG